MHATSQNGLLRRLRAWLGHEIASLYPGSFALVMATGIISNALFLEGYREWAGGLFAINVVAYSCLVAFTIVRLAWFMPAVWADLVNPRLVFSFFTIVAATDVLGMTGDLTPAEQTTLVDYLTDNGAVSSLDLNDYDTRNIKLHGLFTLLMQTPAYQLQ